MGEYNYFVLIRPEGHRSTSELGWRLQVGVEICRNMPLLQLQLSSWTHLNDRCGNLAFRDPKSALTLFCEDSLYIHYVKLKQIRDEDYEISHDK